MKKVHFVNPEHRRCFSNTVLNGCILLFTLLWGISCGDDSTTTTDADQPVSSYVSSGAWSVEYQDGGRNDQINCRLEMRSVEDQQLIQPLDSLHFQSPEIPDSLRFNRLWNLGGGSLLVFSVEIPASMDASAAASASQIRDDAVLIEPEGLRSVYLSDRTYQDIDQERASAAVEPPPEVSHHMRITYDPHRPDSCLLIVDSMVVDFSGSNMDSLLFSFSDANSAVISVEGRFGRGGPGDQFVCYSDSNNIYTGVFITVLGINHLYRDAQDDLIGQSRLTSAFLTGRGFYPLSNTTENYMVTFSLPDSITAWTPLMDTGQGVWVSEPGGITGGLPVAIGNYSRSRLFDRYSLYVLNEDTADSLDAGAVEKIAGSLLLHLDFPSADFSFVEIVFPDGDMVIPGYASLLFSRGSLGVLNDVSMWEDDLASGKLPQGCSIVTGAAEGILMQSLQLDPVIARMLIAWFPLRYYDYVEGDTDGLVALRQSYLSYYLYNTEVLSSGTSTPILEEYALADPKLGSSPMQEFIINGKGVIILEYLASRRMLNRLPYLLQNFTHASSGNYWLKIYSSLRIERGSQQFELLRRLLYLPGIPQLTVDWREDGGRILMAVREIQPGQRFDLQFEVCEIHLPDTTVRREVSLSETPGWIECEMGIQGAGSPAAIDLDPTGVLPADIIYRRIPAD